MSRDLSMVKVTGPLVRYVDGFVAALVGDGYRPASARSHVKLLAHVSRWLEAQGLDAISLTSTRVDEFLRARETEGYHLLLTGKGVAPLLSYLRASGAIPGALVARHSANDDLMVSFREYLIEERGLARSTARDYARVARRFVDDYSVARLEDLNAERVLRFVTDECHRHVPGPVVTGLRAFLRYCYLRGLTLNNLANAIPAVADVGQSLAKSVAPGDVRRLLESCDRTTASGSRNFAILSVLARLGLRAREVAAMELSDIDWRRGELTVRGKGPRVDRLPLPVDVGEAIADWLATGRPPCTHRHVFCRLVAPLDPLTSVGVSAVVAATCRRAQVPVTRAHALRHSAARHLLRSGSNLSEIAQVLRHEDVTTTSVYAKADHATLALVAQPRPSAAAPHASLVSPS
jgi:integrase/recombinase XerD